MSIEETSLGTRAEITEEKTRQCLDKMTSEPVLNKTKTAAITVFASLLSGVSYLAYTGQLKSLISKTVVNLTPYLNTAVSSATPYVSAAASYITLPVALGAGGAILVIVLIGAGCYLTGSNPVNEKIVDYPDTHMNAILNRKQYHDIDMELLLLALEGAERNPLLLKTNQNNKDFHFENMDKDITLDSYSSDTYEEEKDVPVKEKEKEKEETRGDNNMVSTRIKTTHRPEIPFETRKTGDPINDGLDSAQFKELTANLNKLSGKES